MVKFSEHKNIYMDKNSNIQRLLAISLIPCSDNCKYQEDGYCYLNSPGKVTNCSDKGCVYYIKK